MLPTKADRDRLEVERDARLKAEAEQAAAEALAAEQEAVRVAAEHVAKTVKVWVDTAPERVAGAIQGGRKSVQLQFRDCNGFNDTTDQDRLIGESIIKALESPDYKLLYHIHSWDYEDYDYCDGNRGESYWVRRFSHSVQISWD